MTEFRTERDSTVEFNGGFQQTGADAKHSNDGDG